MPDTIQESAYAPFSPAIHEQTAGDTSAIQSPIYGAFGGSSIPNEVDIQASSILGPPYPYSSPPLAVQQPQSPSSLDLSARDGHQNHYSQDLAYSSRNRDFASQTTRYRLLPVNDGQSYAQDRSLGGPVSSGSEQTFQTTLSLPPPPAISPERTAETKNASAKTKEPRKSSSNVVIACHQCRNRKIRCDSTRPSCQNCVRRNNECVYDAAPKRRGPDKHPGARQRSCKKRPADSSAPPPPAKRKRVGDSSIQESEKTMVTPKIKIDTDSVQPAVAHPLSADSRLGLSPTSPLSAQRPLETKPPLPRVEYPSGVTQPAHGPYSPESYAKAYTRQPDMPIQHPRPEYHTKEPMPLSPVLSQHTWLSSLLASFPLEDIISELSFLFDETGFWLSFMNHTTFLQKLSDSYAQRSIQPALVYAGLAMATLMKSSELENGRAGHARAAWFRDKAQQALVESWNARWIDVGLAEAALIIAFYEFSANMDHHSDGIERAIRFLDNIIQTLRLPMTDVNRPHVSVFSANAVPIVVNELDGNTTRDRECACSKNAPAESFSSSTYSPRWDSSWSSKETYEEECRRVCWCALSLVLAYYSQCIAFNREPPTDLYICNSGNYAIFFPGEVGDRAMASLRSSAVLSPKQSVWALYCRSMLLWVYCNRTLSDSEQPEPEATADAWSEMQAIQEALEKHNCGTAMALMHLSREYLHDTRLILTRSLRKLQGFDAGLNIPRADLPLSRKDVEEWVRYVQQTVKRARYAAANLNTPQGYALARRPYQVSWFICQLAMCIFLLSQDRTLTSVQQLAKEILHPLGYMCDLFPSPTLRAQYSQLRDQFTDFCNKTGQSPPKLHSLPIMRSA